MKILIVEDNPISATVLEHTLDKHGYDTLTAHDGEEALSHLESHPEIELIITDLVMPNTDGIELVHRIRERKEWHAIPILVCTSMRPENATQRLNGHGWKFILKPINAESLIQKVNEAIAQQTKVLQDPAITMGQIGLDTGAFAEVVDKFSETVNENIIRLEQQADTVSSRWGGFERSLGRRQAGASRTAYRSPHQPRKQLGWAASRSGSFDHALVVEGTQGDAISS